MTRKLIPLDLIDPNPWQPRTSDDPEHLQNLAISIAKDGLLQPPAARKVGERYQLAFGHSRFRAMGYLHITWKVDGNWFSDHGLPIDDKQDFSEMPLEIVQLDDEAMYRHAISENLQRKDLNAIEEAQAMKRAMDDFKYTSAQVGELFGKNEATVRGMIRYLELPEDAQGALSRGEMSQSTARTILSMQRIATAVAISEVVKSIKVSDGQRQPDEVVRIALSTAKGVVELFNENWWGNQDKKPRGGGDKGWLLDMKKFPNKLLPALMANDIIAALEIKPDSRQAHMVKHHADDLPLLLGMLETSDWSEDKLVAPKLNHLINPPACTACQFYTRIRGSHYCGLGVCFGRKEIAWESERLRALSEKLEIAVYSDSDGEFRILDNSDDHNYVWRQKNADLRLIRKDVAKNNHYQYNYKGVETDLCYVVLTGKTLKDLLATQKTARAKKRDADKLATGRAELFSAKRDELYWEAALYFGALFDGFGYEAINALYKAPQYGWAHRGNNVLHGGADQDAESAMLRRVVALNMLRNSCHYPSDVQDMANQINVLAQKCGVSLGDSFTEMANETSASIEEAFPSRASKGPMPENVDEPDVDADIDEDDEELEDELEEEEA